MCYKHMAVQRTPQPHPNTDVTVVQQLDYTCYKHMTVQRKPQPHPSTDVAVVQQLHGVHILIQTHDSTTHTTTALKKVDARTVTYLA